MSEEDVNLKNNNLLNVQVIGGNGYTSLDVDAGSFHDLEEYQSI